MRSIASRTATSCTRAHSDPTEAEPRSCFLFCRIFFRRTGIHFVGKCSSSGVERGTVSRTSSSVFVANSFDVVSVEVDDKRREVAGAVVCTEAGCAVVRAAVSEGRTMEFRDSVRIGRGKGDMKARTWRSLSFGAMLESQFVATARYAITDSLIGLSGPNVRPYSDISEWGKCRIVERG